MLREYQIAGNSNLSTEVLDPLTDPEIESEANQSYGIRPTPFQIAGRNESSIVNAYFNILVRYGDQSVVLNLDDLIEVSQGVNTIDVKLQNLEYDLTAAIKKVVYGFQSLDAILAGFNEPARLTLFITEQTLPENEYEIANLVIQEGQKIQEKSNGKFVFDIINPDDSNATITRQQLMEEYGVQPFPVQLFSQDTYFFNMILESEGQTQVLYPPTEANEADVRTTIESALKRTASGFLKTIGVWIPPQTPTQDAFGQTQQPLSSYNMVLEQLQKDYNLTLADLASGQVSSQIDTLLIIAPQDLQPVEQYAIDQFLMRGGAVILVVSPYKLDVDQFSGFLTLTPIQTGIQQLLSFYGINLSNQLVLDTQNAAFPVIVTRDAGGMQINEIQAVDYPFFIDVRQNGMAADNMILANLTAVSMNWTSLVTIEDAAAELLNTENLLVSSPSSWVTDNTNIQPDFETYPETGFQPGENPQSYPLAVSVQGQLPSYFAGQPIPEVTNSDGSTSPASNATIEQASGNARIIVFGSTALVDDFALQLSNQLSQDYYVNNLRLIQNAVDWSVEDTDLLSIRSRGSAIRILAPMENSQQLFWEISTYVIVVLLLVAIFIYWRYRQKKNQVILFNNESISEAQHE